MSKRNLVQYIATLDQNALEEQLLDLYDRFPAVKTYYDFIFNPKEDRLVDEAKVKIGKEYFPQNGRRPKKRRSVAQKHIRHFKTLGLDPVLLADVMLFHIEVAQTFTADMPINQEAFYKSMLKGFREAVQHISYHLLYHEYKDRLDRIVDQAIAQDWLNADLFAEMLEEL